MTAVAAPSVESPYKGLAPYEEADASYFFGRDADAELVVANALAARLTLLFGESGVGKSSLLRAGAAPRLRAAGDLVLVVFSDWRGDAAASLSAALGEAGGLNGESAAAAPLAATIAACAERWGRDVILVLDQFEEYFVYHPDDERGDRFALEFPRAVTQADLPVSFLIAIREDALARLERFKGRIPGLFDTYLRLNRLGRDAAREAIVAPLRRHAEANAHDAVTAEPDLVEKVLDDVAVGRFAFGSSGAGLVDGTGSAGAAAEPSIEAPYLQLVMSRLWEEERLAASQVLRMETLERLGGAERIVRTHLDVALDALSEEDQEVAAAVFRYLVTPSGTKIAHRVDDLAEYAGYPREAVASVLRRLAAGGTRVVRPAGDDSYEIYHDVLAAAVLDWRGRYLHARELAAVDRRRRLRLRLVVVALALAVAGGVAAGITIWRVQANRAADARRQAEAQALEVARAEPYSKAIYTGHRAPVNSVSFSPDGHRAVSVDNRGELRIWSTSTGGQIAALHSGGELLGGVFSPDGSLVAAAGSDGKATIWRWRDGKELASHSEPFGLDWVSFSPDGRLVSLSGDDGTVRVWDWQSERVVRILDGQGGVVRQAVFSPDGRFIVAGSDDGDARVWDWRRDKRPVVTLRTRPGQTVYGVAFSPDGQLVAIGGQDERVRVFRWRDREERWSKRVGDNSVEQVAFNRDGSIVATATGDDVARVWNWRHNRLITTLSGGASAAVAFSPDGCLLATAGYDGAARVWAPPLPGCAH